MRVSGGLGRRRPPQIYANTPEQNARLGRGLGVSKRRAPDSSVLHACGAPAPWTCGFFSFTFAREARALRPGAPAAVFGVAAAPPFSPGGRRGLVLPTVDWHSWGLTSSPGGGLFLYAYARSVGRVRLGGLGAAPGAVCSWSGGHGSLLGWDGRRWLWMGGGCWTGHLAWDWGGGPTFQPPGCIRLRTLSDCPSAPSSPT